MSQLKRSDERLDLSEAALCALRREAADSAGTMAEVSPILPVQGIYPLGWPCMHASCLGTTSGSCDAQLH